MIPVLHEMLLRGIREPFIHLSLDDKMDFKCRLSANAEFNNLNHFSDVFEQLGMNDNKTASQVLKNKQTTNKNTKSTIYKYQIFFSIVWFFCFYLGISF